MKTHIRRILATLILLLFAVIAFRPTTIATPQTGCEVAANAAYCGGGCGVGCCRVRVACVCKPPTRE